MRCTWRNPSALSLAALLLPAGASANNWDVEDAPPASPCAAGALFPAARTQNFDANGPRRALRPEDQRT